MTVVEPRDEASESSPVKATVLITTYNHEKFIAQAVDSVLRQECDFPFEILIADDASTDSTRKLLERYAVANPLIRFFLPEENLGQFGNRMLVEALAQCRGEYMAWLDGDDYWTDQKKLQTMVSLLDQHPEWDGAFHPVAVLTDGAKKPATVLAPPEIKSVYRFEDLLFRNFVPSSGTVYRLSRLKPLEPLDRYLDIICLDWVLHLLRARSGGLGYIHRVMGVYRMHGRGVWSRLAPVQRLEEALGFIERIPELFQYDNRPFRRRLAREWVTLAAVERAAGRREQGLAAARKAFRDDPHSLRNRLLVALTFVCPAFAVRLFTRARGAIGRRLLRAEPAH